jgi:hypothetical protein
VFNVADASISVGVAVLIIGVWIREQVQKRASAGRPPGQSDPAPEPVSEEPPLER